MSAVELLQQAIKELVQEEVNQQTKDLKEIISRELSSEKEVAKKLVTQTEAARLCKVSVPTFKKYREMGLESEPSPTGKLLFDMEKVESWKAANDKRKIR